MTKSLILAGGCFWCVEHDLREAPGVVSVTSGYSGGDSTSPTYENHTGHKEVVLVEYVEELGSEDAASQQASARELGSEDTEHSSANVKTQGTSYKKLLQFFIDHIDPTDDGGQFADRGTSYKSGIFYENEDEKTIAENVIKELDGSRVYDTPSSVEILERKPFYKAEEYHQKYADKNPAHYAMYRSGSGRESFVNKTCQIRNEKHIVWSD